MSDLETVPTAASARTRRMPDGELVFAVEHALEVIQACTSSEIAVLGIEIFPGLNVSTYDREVKDPAEEEFWPGYVEANNALAEDFIRRNPAPRTSECILTTALREFCGIERQSNK
jgi:hypothetical protein